MENDIKERTILTQEKFQEYINQTKIDSDLLEYLYTIILLRDSGLSFTDIANKLFGKEFNENEVIDQLNSIIKGYDIRTITENQFLKYIPSEYRDTIAKFKKIYNTARDNNLEIEEIFQLEQLDSLNEEINEIRDTQIQSIAKTISSCNLSQIPPEMYNDINWLNKIDFQNTNANIDMNQWMKTATYGGSFKGCTLISYNPSHYHYHSSLLEQKYYPTKDDLDMEQYSVVMNGYKTTDYFPTNLYYLFESEDVKANSDWLFDRLSKDPKASTYELVSAWKLMNDEQQNNYRLIFERIIEKSKLENKVDIFQINEAIKKTNFKILELYHNKLIELCTIDNKSFDMKSYISAVWLGSHIEYQRAHLEEIAEQVCNDDGSLKNVELFENIYKFCKPELCEEKFSYFMNKYINKKNNTINNSQCDFVKFLSSFDGNIEMPEESLKQIFKLYTNEDNSFFRNIFADVWKNIGANNQSRYLENFITLQKKLGISENRMYEIWNSTDAKIRLEKFDSFTEFIKSQELPNLEHQVQGEGYIQLIRDLGDEGQKVVYSNLPQFFYSLREKYDGNTEEAESENDEKYDTKYIQSLLDMDSKNVFDKDNINIIIDNLPRLGIDIINRIYFSNSEMLSKYSKQLIKSISTQSQSEAIKSVEEFENIFSQNRLPQFMKLYKYFELVSNKDLAGKNIIEEIISNKNGNMSPVLQNSPSERMGKRIVFSDLMKITMDSNNRSMKNFIDLLETGNQAYVKFIKDGGKITSLNDDERNKLDEFVKTLYCLYENSDVAKIDKSANTKIYLTGDIEQDALTIGSRYSRDGKVGNLPDLVLKTYIGPYQELFGGVVTIKQMKEYMENKIADSNEYHRQLAEKPIELSVGDMVKGISGHEKILQDLFQDGIRAGEFLGTESHSDLTPLDTDFVIILPSNNGKTLSEKIQNTPADSYGNFYVVVKHNPEKIEYTRSAVSIEDDINLEKSSDRMSKLNEKDEIRRRIKVRSERYI